MTNPDPLPFRSIYSVRSRFQQFCCCTFPSFYCKNGMSCGERRWGTTNCPPHNNNRTTDTNPNSQQHADADADAPASSMGALSGGSSAHGQAPFRARSRYLSDPIPGRCGDCQLSGHYLPMLLLPWNCRCRYRIVDVAVAVDNIAKCQFSTFSTTIITFHHDQNQYFNNLCWLSSIAISHSFAPLLDCNIPFICPSPSINPITDTGRYIT
jgi:hypothetical protein